MNFPPFLRCTRTGNGDWRCTEMQAPGRAYCQRHYIEQKRRNERKRLRKLAAASVSTNRCKVTKTASAFSSDKRKLAAHEDSATDETDSEDDEETESEEEYALKQGISGGDGRVVSNFEFEEDNESESEVVGEDEVVGVPNWRWRTFTGQREEVRTDEKMLKNGNLYAGVFKRSVVGKRSSVSRKRRDMSRGWLAQGYRKLMKNC